MKKIEEYLRATGRLAKPAEPEEPEAPQVTEPENDDDLDSLLGGEEEKAPTEQEVRQALADVARKRDVPTLKKLLSQYGANGLSEVPKESYVAIYAAAMRLLD